MAEGNVGRVLLERPDRLAAMPHRIRVGITDDDDAVRLTLNRALSRAADVELVAAVGDGEPAVSLAQSGSIDVLILDLEMPNVSGLEALARIRQVAPAVAVIIHSSRPASKAAAAMLEAGASAYVEKPCSFELLVQAVRDAAAQRRAR